MEYERRGILILKVWWWMTKLCFWFKIKSNIALIDDCYRKLEANHYFEIILVCKIPQKKDFYYLIKCCKVFGKPIKKMKKKKKRMERLS